jgi:hypothetical protein
METRWEQPSQVAKLVGASYTSVCVPMEGVVSGIGWTVDERTRQVDKRLGWDGGGMEIRRERRNTMTS